MLCIANNGFRQQLHWAVITAGVLAQLLCCPHEASTHLLLLLPTAPAN
jgi:hypothetical protein